MYPNKTNRKERGGDTPITPVVNSEHIPLKHPRPKLPDLVNDQRVTALIVVFLGENHQVGVGSNIERPLCPLHVKHGCRGGGDGFERLRDCCAGPVEEVVYAVD